MGENESLMESYVGVDTCVCVLIEMSTTSVHMQDEKRWWVMYERGIRIWWFRRITMVSLLINKTRMIISSICYCGRDLQHDHQSLVDQHHHDIEYCVSTVRQRFVLSFKKMLKAKVRTPR